GTIPAGLVMMERPDADLAVPALYEAWLFAWRGPPPRPSLRATIARLARAALRLFHCPIPFQKGQSND
ncbi:MAG: hypothetical protein Q8R97_07010, partial [Brevundimonas sp.]|nr:hypothetical protein [Brevundimonas sp.]